MSVTQFAMVEELAHLVKDNLRCKHLVLSMEDAFVNFLQHNNNEEKDETEAEAEEENGIIELEPMDPYSRLLLHRLADIFGFGHVSVGEGDDRHLILQRCPDTCVPSILVSDILFQYDESHPLTMSYQLMTTNHAASAASPVPKTKSPSFLTLEEKEAAYLAARQRIFSVDVREMEEPQRQKPRTVPVVARRMIAHALGQNISPKKPDFAAKNGKGYEVQTAQLNVQDRDKIDTITSLGEFQETIAQPRTNVHLLGKAKSNNHQRSAPSPGKKNMSIEPGGKISTNISTSHNGSSRNRAKEYSKEEHVGAAKRMFAHALGLQSAKGGLARCSATKPAETERG